MAVTIAAAEARIREEAVVAKAALRAAEQLGLSGRTLALVIGVSEATLSRIRSGRAALERGSKPFELAVLFIRMFRSLDAIVGGETAVARAWLQNPNIALGAAPLERIVTIPGLMDVIAYLDARRALV